MQGLCSNVLATFWPLASRASGPVGTLSRRRSGSTTGITSLGAWRVSPRLLERDEEARGSRWPDGAAPVAASERRRAVRGSQAQADQSGLRGRRLRLAVRRTLRSLPGCRDGSCTGDSDSFEPPVRRVRVMRQSRQRVEAHHVIRRGERCVDRRLNPRQAGLRRAREFVWPWASNRATADSAQSAVA